MLGVPQEAEVRYHDRVNGPQPPDDFSSIVEPTHMSVAGGEYAIRLRLMWILLDREEQFRHRLIKAPPDEMRETYYIERVADAGAGTEA